MYMVDGYANVVLKVKEFKQYCEVRKTLGNSHFQNDTAVAKFLGYSKGQLSQIFHALDEPEKIAEVGVSGKFVATLMMKTNTSFSEFFQVVPVKNYNPKEKYEKFYART